METEFEKLKKHFDSQFEKGELDVQKEYKKLTHNELTGTQRNALIKQIILKYTSNPELYNFDDGLEMEYLLANLILDLMLNLGELENNVSTFASSTLHTILLRNDCNLLFELKILLYTLAVNKELADCLILFNRFFIAGDELKLHYDNLECWVNGYA